MILTGMLFIHIVQSIAINDRFTVGAGNFFKHIAEFDSAKIR